ncbi:MULTISPECIES: metal ABC transporter solute-binding protein, Zn/Mn family [Xanthobacter]|uniref:Metal ABC transporter substrate-binding protein n=1 Tax=Xanthobacter flavus TaxID=281 RepID=A0A9W6CNY0_XANFL|nr:MULTISPECIES: zinc ABC transporter substrate-binding protein [Xanthobacter]MBN8918501.1 zinc ABC transporter substrate-binding protein [Hyphomicrobiales bacterium]MDR6334584.1 zinc/manganese transport system substrate-binding protein [Xanthobacter flavus]UDQ89336.1 zinc ABC transporter substrate-binding protein [Xanthobacter autotrophicus]UJX44928.1 metal ABC transporter substrate-binding protein [Xanthobacter sp. YC-JY1]GLI23397.1 metal ABC transporter substrate-binding protein [Xanthobact
MISRRLLLAAGVAGTLAAGLGLPMAGPALAQAPAQKMPVVASFSILGDFVKQVGGDRVAVTTIVGPNGDAHVYQPTPADAKAVAAAKVVFVNGLGFEGWMDRLIKASGTKAPIVVATKGITPRTGFVDHDDDEKPKGKGKDKHDHAKEGGHDHGGIDPHAWQSIANAKIYVANVRDGLIAADPDGRDAYTANAAAYTAKLDALEAEVKSSMAKIPAEQRRIITSHDAFGYFGEAYGLTLIAPEGVSTESEASAKDVGRIIRQIKAQKIPAVFVENVTDPRLIQRIAKESGAKVGGELYSDALSDDKGPASTYIDMMHSNVRELSTALSS